MIAPLSFAVSTLALRPYYARYFEAQDEYGVRSVHSRKASSPVAFGIIGLVVVFAAIFFVVFKGVHVVTVPDGPGHVGAARKPGLDRVSFA